MVKSIENAHTLIMHIMTLLRLDTELCLLTIVKYLSKAIIVIVPIEIIMLEPSNTGTSLQRKKPKFHCRLRILISVKGIQITHMVMSEMLRLTMYKFRGVCICDLRATTKQTSRLADIPKPIKRL